MKRKRDLAETAFAAALCLVAGFIIAAYAVAVHDIIKALTGGGR